MKKDKTKRTIYFRIFSSLLAIYLILMIGFSAFFISQQKEIAGMNLQTYALNESASVERKLKDYVNENNKITDLDNVKKEFVNYLYAEKDTEVAVFTGDYQLLFNTNNYWTVSYTSHIVGNTHYTEYAYLNPKDWFSNEEIREIEHYLYAKPMAEKIGDLEGYVVDIRGFWVDNEMIIPEKITVTEMYAQEFDEDGNVTSSGGTHDDDIVYHLHYENSKGLPYFDSIASIIPNNIGNPNNEKQNALREAVINPNHLKEMVPQFFTKFIEKEIFSERVSLLNYRYYWIEPYQRTLSDGESAFWTVVGRNVNLWEQCSPTLMFVWISCLIIFIMTAFIISNQTYQTYKKREKLERQRKDMTNALAHDLKTPLSIISGYAQNLQENVQIEKKEHYITQIQENIKRMNNVIREMLEISKIESETFKLNFEEISLYDLSQEVINRYKAICDEKTITVQLEGESIIKADRALLERVIDNFVINAIENMPKGGDIRISIQDHTFEVCNSGSHIPEEKMDEIWLPFKKGDESRGKTKGTGLGLAITRKILELHQFSYGARNSEDGVIFWFKFQ